MTDAQSPAPVREGDILAKKYRVEEVLGVGGMGVVVAAMHLQLDQRVALKFLLPSVLHNKDVVARFAREARAAAKIRSEHVARVIDVGELDSGSPYMVMEFLEGEDLAQLVERRGALPVADVVSHILQACDALAEAHAIGIVHRDLKPANLFLAARPDKTSIVKVLDFGISKSVGTADAALTNTQVLMGSPYYMSPEQLISSKNVDARSDVWAIGVILYELLTGVRPFDGETMPALVAAIIQTDPPPLSDVLPGLPAPMRAAVMRCLEKDRQNRFVSVAALASALLPFAPDGVRHLPNRMARVLGERPSDPDAVGEPVSTPGVPASGLAPSVLGKSAYESGVDKRAVEDSPGNLAAKSAVSWAGTHLAAPPPPVLAFPRRPALALAAVVLVVVGGLAVFFKTSKAPAIASASSAALVTPENPSAAAGAAIPPTTTSSIVLLPLDAGAATTGEMTTSRADAGGGAAPHASAGTAHVAPVKSARPNVRAFEPLVTPPEPPTQSPPAAEPTNKMKMDMK